MGKVRSHELRTLPKEELLRKLDEVKSHLSSLRTAQVTGAPASKVAQIKTMRKSAAKVLTVLNQNQKAALRKVYAGKKFIPHDLRAKKTRAMRRALKPEELAVRTLRAQKMAAAFPERKFALSL
eukprot:TRINITY_DN965_c1_g1_i1.p2 TRINITY_DN965_c1_g1~~TRINITY_DN965_c1_g1_i1.p2  ORF type:complete len:124 (+),score=55.74 TRINITY_DN965_c1_g1_i1:139-510(+)